MAIDTESINEPPHLRSPRVLFYAVNGLGLGHVSRQLAIARAVRAARPAAQILFITTTEADSVIYREGFASVKIPSRTIVTATHIRAATYNKLVQSVVMNTVAAFNPAILVADTYPAGASQELLSTLSWEMRRVFVYRVQQEARAGDSFFQAALGHYHLCIAPHEEGSEFLPTPAGLPVVWTGAILIRERSTAFSRIAARQRLGIETDRPLLYVTVGGGGDAQMAQSEDLLLRCAREAGWATAAPDAPLNPGTLAQDRPDFRLNYFPMAECLSAFDAAISAGGYNSVAELLHYGVPSVLIPRPRGLDDQFARCETARIAGAALTASLDEADVTDKLMQLTDASLRRSMAAQGPPLVAEGGAARAAAAILELLTS